MDNETPEADQPVSEQPVAEQPASAEAVAGSTPELTLGQGAPASVAEEEPLVAPVLRGKVDRFGVAMGTGRRKTSVARVRLKTGDGNVTIYGRTLEEYCPLEQNRQMIKAPLEAADRLGKVDLWVRVEGGGTTGQAGAIVLGLARALEALDAGLHATLKEGGWLTRDDRMVERKKYGFKKARRSFQFSKR